MEILLSIGFVKLATALIFLGAAIISFVGAVFGTASKIYQFYKDIR